MTYTPVRPILGNTSAQKWCEQLKGLDEFWNTSPNSPLHHDHRCALCQPDARKRATFPSE